MILRNSLQQIASASALVLILAMNATAADAARRAQPRDHDRAAGQWTRHTEGQRTATGRQAHSTVTNRNGKQATRDVTVARNAEAGTRTRSVVDTGPNGGQRSVSDVTQRTDNGFTRDQTVVRANGSTATRNVMVANEAGSGTRNREVVYTGANGGQATNSVVTQRTDNGYTRTATATGPHGNQATRDVTATFDAATGTFTRDVSVNSSASTP